MGITVGIRQTFGLFLAPISVDLNLGRETFAFGMGAMNLIWGVAAPFAGAVADQYGAGRVAIAGGLSYATGLAVMTVTGDGGQLLVGGLLVGLGLSGAGFTVVLGAVGRAAPPEKRTLALGMASMGGSIGQFVALPYTHLLIDWLGWSACLLILAMTALLIVAFGGWITQGTTVAFVLSLAGVPGCF
jgi:MFS family permease